MAPKPVAARPLDIVDSGAAAEPALEIGLGTNAVCVRLGGRVHCGVGDDAVPLSSTPPLGGIEDATSLSFAMQQGCIATKKGTVHCFDDVRNGELPVVVPGITDARRVFAGDQQSCALTGDGSTWCWDRGMKLTRLALRDVAEVASTIHDMCVRTKSGDVTCFSTDATTQNQPRFPTTSLAGVTSVAGMHSVFCAVAGGEVSCFGALYGFLDGIGPERDVDLRRVGVTGATKVGTGGQHACALMRDGSVMCWGVNANAELGTPDDPRRGHPYPPTAVPGVLGARDLAVGRSLTCAIMAADDVWCWGEFPWPRMGSPRRADRPVRLRLR